jgi:hypothetical protein
MLTSPSRGRRSSIAALFGQNQSPNLFGSSSSKSSNKLLGKLGNKKAKSPTSSSEKILNQFGSGVVSVPAQQLGLNLIWFLFVFKYIAAFTWKAVISTHYLCSKGSTLTRLTLRDSFIF